MLIFHGFLNSKSSCGSASMIDVGSQGGPNGRGETNDYICREHCPVLKQPCKRPIAAL